MRSPSHGSRHESAFNQRAQAAGQILERFARADVLVIDEWGLAPVKNQERRDLLEVMEDRYGTRSTIVTSQLPTSKWHDYLG